MNKQINELFNHTVGLIVIIDSPHRIYFKQAYKKSTSVTSAVNLQYPTKECLKGVRSQIVWIDCLVVQILVFESFCRKLAMSFLENILLFLGWLRWKQHEFYSSNPRYILHLQGSDWWLSLTSNVSWTQSWIGIHKDSTLRSDGSRTDSVWTQFSWS